MKKLSNAEIMQMTVDRAWDIAGEFGELLASGNHNNIYEFEDVLPYPKSTILLAILKILTEENFDKNPSFKEKQKEIKEALSANAIFLMNFIPSEEQYEEMLGIKDLTKNPPV